MECCLSDGGKTCCLTDSVAIALPYLSFRLSNLQPLIAVKTLAICVIYLSLEDEV